LLARGLTVMLETGGYRPVTRVPPAVVKIVDVKCPGSGEASKNDWGNLDRLSPHDELTFVVQDRADYEFARELIGRHLQRRRVRLVRADHQLRPAPRAGARGGAPCRARARRIASSRVRDRSPCHRRGGAPPPGGRPPAPRRRWGRRP